MLSPQRFHCVCLCSWQFSLLIHNVTQNLCFGSHGPHKHQAIIVSMILHLQDRSCIWIHYLHLKTHLNACIVRNSCDHLHHIWKWSGLEITTSVTLLIPSLTAASSCYYQQQVFIILKLADAFLALLALICWVCCTAEIQECILTLSPWNSLRLTFNQALAVGQMVSHFTLEYRGVVAWLKNPDAAYQRFIFAKHDAMHYD